MRPIHVLILTSYAAVSSFSGVKGIPREEVHMATRSRKGYWRMNANSIVQPVCVRPRTGRRALTNQWLHEQGVPDMRKTWIILHCGPDARI